MRVRTIFILIAALIVNSCAKVPITERKQVNMLPESSLMTMSLTNYKTFLSENQVIHNSANAEMVQRVGSKISAVVNKYMNENGYANRVKNYQWEFNLVNDKLVNAWCMPGGKVVVYEGLIPVTLDEDGLAVVMGHEIAHAIARHGNERMSQKLIAVAGGVSLAVMMKDKPNETRNIFLAAYGVGGALGILAYSRSHESEADRMGLVFMALAGYNPQKAIDFWERMSQTTGSGGIPEFLRTHPSHDTRIQRIKEYLPEAMTYYNSK